MNRKENRKKWYEALRNGEYEQTVQTLQHGESYCCLGVACKVAEKEEVVVNYDDSCLQGDTLEEQQNVINWLGLRDACLNIPLEISEEPDNDFGASITEANDDMDKTFEEIADFLEKHDEELFE